MRPTSWEIERGYSECGDCDNAIHLHQAGYEVETHLCSMCKCYVADKEQFYNIPVEILSK